MNTKTPQWTMFRQAGKQTEHTHTLSNLQVSCQVVKRAWFESRKEAESRRQRPATEKHQQSCWEPAVGSECFKWPEKGKKKISTRALYSRYSVTKSVHLSAAPWAAALQASLSIWACSDSCPLSQWCRPTTSSSAVAFSSCLQACPESGSFLVSRLFASGG